MRFLTEQVSDEQAMWRVREHNDQGAFALLVERWQAPLRRLAVRMLEDESRAEDLSQEAFTRVFLHRREYRPEFRFSTWIWRISLNLCHDEIRRRKRRPESPLESVTGTNEGLSRDGASSTICLAAESASPAEHAAAVDTTRQVRQALQQLPEIYRSVVVLRHYEGLKFSEIALGLDLPEGTVKSRMVESLAQLGRLLAPLLADRVVAAIPIEVSLNFAPVNPGAGPANSLILP